MKGPLIELLPKLRDDPNEEARRELLYHWAETVLRPQFSWLWPEQTAGGRPGGKPVPWPRCWRLHPAFVAQLQMLMDWALDIENGNGSYREAVEWQTYLRTILKADVYDIALRTCADGHIDASVPRRPRAPERVSTPVLPWTQELA